MSRHRHILEKPLIYIYLKKDWPLLLQTISNECIKKNWQCVFQEILYHERPLALNSKITGVITDSFYDDVHIKDFIKKNIPIVRVGDSLDKNGDKVIPAVIGSLESFGTFAAEYFSKRNFHTLAYVGNKQRSTFSNASKEFLSKADSLNMQVHQLLLESVEQLKNHSSLFDYYTTKIGDWLKTLPRPVGLFAYSDKQAMRLSLICQQVGLKIPNDVAILGIGNIAKYCETTQTPLSSIEPYHRNIGVEATRLLNELLVDKKAFKGVKTIKPNLVFERQSTDVFAIKNKHVAHALRLLWSQLGTNINFLSLAKDVGLSLRSLEMKFKEHLGRTMVEEVLRKRLEIAQRKLISSDHNIVNIANESGFISMSYFRKVFKIRYNELPSVYREKYSIYTN
jgi:LacI family transcriptional regulator